MGSRLQKELKQAKPFVSREEEVYLSIQRTAEMLWWGVSDTLKQADLTPAQYNVLRILRGAGQAGACCGEISERLVTKDSDITRLLDRLDARGLISRVRDTKDRRLMLARITDKGLRVLDELDKPIAECHRRQLGHLKQGQLESLSGLLDLARNRP